MSLLLARLLLAPLAFVCISSKLLVLLSRLVNSVKLSRLALDADCRFSVELELRWTADGDPGVKLNVPGPSSESSVGNVAVPSRAIDDDAIIDAICG
jgi:hypothetical protein